LTGDYGNDTLFGGKANDVLTIEQGSDTAFGGKGNDFLSFNEGDHVGTGGAGADLFLFRYDGFASTQKAEITDFEDGIDRLRFVAIFPNQIDSPDDFVTVKDTAKGLHLVTDNGWDVFVKGLTVATFSNDDLN
jgi:peroxidase